MAPQRIAVVCTGGKRRHARHTFNTLTVTADSITANVLRKVAEPDLAGVVVDGIALPGYAVVKDYNPRYGAHGWRWACPVCGADRQFADDRRLRDWLATRGSRADITRRA
jgi:hypothetical protein